MTFVPVTVYGGDGAFLGYGIKQDAVEGQATKGLHTVNLWAPGEIDELREQLARLNAEVNILQFWPDVRDPEVQDILADETWEPVEKEPYDIVDEEKSPSILWQDEEGGLRTIDYERSDLVWKTVEVPSPSAIQQRIKKACEVVARRRAGL